MGRGVQDDDSLADFLSCNIKKPSTTTTVPCSESTVFELSID